MARPKFQFTDRDAVSLSLYLAPKLNDSSWVAANLVNPTKDRWFHAPAEMQKELAAIFEGSRDLFKSEDKDSVGEPAARMAKWLASHVHAAGWTRIQAARRQQALTDKNRSALNSGSNASIDVTSRASWELSRFAENVGVDRKTFVAELVGDLSMEANGRAYLRQFSEKLKTRLRAEFTAELTKAFGLAPSQLRSVKEQLGEVAFEESFTLLQKVGDTKLAKLAAWAKNAYPKDPLLEALTAKAALAGNSPLQAIQAGVSPRELTAKLGLGKSAAAPINVSKDTQ